MLGFSERYGTWGVAGYQKKYSAATVEQSGILGRFPCDLWGLARWGEVYPPDSPAPCVEGYLTPYPKVHQPSGTMEKPRAMKRKIEISKRKFFQSLSLFKAAMGDTNPGARTLDSGFETTRK